MRRSGEHSPRQGENDSTGDEHAPERVEPWSDTMRAVVAALIEMGHASTAEIVETAGVSDSAAYARLWYLRDRGLVEQRRDAWEPRRVIWVDRGLDRIDETGAINPASVVHADDSTGTEVRR